MNRTHTLFKKKITFTCFSFILSCRKTIRQLFLLFVALKEQNTVNKKEQYTVPEIKHHILLFAYIIYNV